MIEVHEIAGHGQDVEADGEAVAMTVTLSFEQRQRTRLRVRTDSGEELAVILPRGTVLHDGDVLQATSGQRIAVRAAAEEVSTVRCADAVALARACYHLGNRHVALQIGAGWARYRHDHVLDDMVRGLGLPVAAGLLPFEPEGGAYSHNHSGSQGHGHGHGHGHDHGHSHDHGHGHLHAVEAGHEHAGRAHGTHDQPGHRHG